MNVQNRSFFFPFKFQTPGVDYPLQLFFFTLLFFLLIRWWWFYNHVIFLRSWRLCDSLEMLGVVEDEKDQLLSTTRYTEEERRIYWWGVHNYFVIDWYEQKYKIVFFVAPKQKRRIDFSIKRGNWITFIATLLLGGRIAVWCTLTIVIQSRLSIYHQCGEQKGVEWWWTLKRVGTAM